MKTHFFISLLFCTPLLSSGQQITNLNATQLNVSGVNQIELTWQTNNENGWCYFIIERDTNNQNNFTTYDTLYANGSTTNTTNYLYTDFGPLLNGVSYCYRLRLDTMDYLGNCHFNRYSDTVCVNYTTSIEEQTTTPFVIFPNPTIGNVIIEGKNTIIAIQIYNAIGEIIYDTTNPNYSRQLIIDISDKANGIYFIAINSENNIYYHKLIKQ